jgi:hypothetical protein
LGLKALQKLPFIPLHSTFVHILAQRLDLSKGNIPSFC